MYHSPRDVRRVESAANAAAALTVARRLGNAAAVVAVTVLRPKPRGPVPPAAPANPPVVTAAK